MSEKKIKIIVNNNFKFELQQSEISELDLLKLPNSNFHLLKNNKSITASLLNSNFNNRTYVIAINNTKYVVKINNEIDDIVKKIGLSAGLAEKRNIIKAPMPGLILSVNAVEGQEIKKGEVLLVLEAMKMENTLIAPISGIVKKLHAVKGNTVDKGTLLIEMA